jgi:uncharacterized protein
MVVRHETWEPGTPAWVDISVTDLARSQDFYRRVLGWEFSESTEEYGGYCNAMVDGETVAGMAPPMEGMEEPPHVWTTYLAVTDAEEAAGKVTEAGGQVMLPPMEVGAFGTMCMAVDPTGAVFGLWQAGEHTGFNLANEPGSVTWNEAMVADLDRGQEFYRQVFGFDYQDMSGDGYRYASMSLGDHDRPVGGIGEVEGETPPHWAVTFAVTDTDEAVATVTEAGGAVLTPAFDSEFGRIAVVTGPDGEMFALMSSAQAAASDT